jgi:RNA methyltransferase, TrmH family
MLIKSRVKYIQSLGQKKFRDDEAVFVAEGPKIINELLSAENVQMLSLLAVGEWFETNSNLFRKIASSDFLEINQKELDRISFLTTSNQVLGIFRKPTFPVLDLKGKVTLVLDSIQDPGNLGTIVRIADWFGVKNIICSMETADVFNPKTIQSTMGSISRVQVLYRDLKKILLENASLPLYGTQMKGKSIMETTRISEGLILIGNESKGICEDLLKLVHFPVTIPRRGEAESLNVAVATGIILSYLL